MPTRIRRTIRSAVWATSGSDSFDASNATNERPPGLLRSLWQVAQYCLTIAVCCSAVISPAIVLGSACAVAIFGALPCCGTGAET